MFRNKIAYIILLIPALLFLQGCQDNIILPETVNRLQAPRLLYPPNDTSDIVLPVTFSWSASRGADSYRLQVSTDSLFNAIIYDTGGLSNMDQAINDLDYSKTYYWHVQSFYQDGISDWSDSWNFTTIIMGKPCNGMLTVEYEGKLYNTVQIGSQCWLKENLDVGSVIYSSSNPTDNDTIEKYCYINNPDYCQIYGGLYEWWEAMQYSTKEGAQGICPNGFHVPTIAEYQTLSERVKDDGNYLKEVGQGIGDGAGTNTSGFSALLAGIGKSDGSFFGLGSITVFWASTEYSLNFAYNFSLFFSISKIYFSDSYKGSRFSVRCLKD